MKTRTAIAKHIRTTIAELLGFADIDAALGDHVSEAYRRGLISGYAATLRSFYEEGSPEWLGLAATGEAQRGRVLELKAGIEAGLIECRHAPVAAG